MNVDLLRNIFDLIAIFLGISFTFAAVWATIEDRRQDATFWVAWAIFMLLALK